LESFHIIRQDLFFSIIDARDKNNKNHFPKYFVAYCGKNALGVYGIVKETSTDQWRLFTIAVLPAFRRRGIAKKLITSAISHLKDTAPTTVYVGVPQDNWAAIGLYRNMGFLPDETSAFVNRQLVTMKFFVKTS
jgi:ribosomal protein S18 acetylase RimI-like enzyme